MSDFSSVFGKSEQPKEEPEKRGPVVTSSIFGRENLQNVATRATSALQTLSKVLPASIRSSDSGRWVGGFVQNLLEKGGPELADFASSPAGIALIGLHMFPLTAPVAGVIDLGFVGGAALQAVPQAVTFAKDPTPENGASLALSLFVAKGMKEAGARQIRRSTRESKPGYNKAVMELAQKYPEHTMKMAVLDTAKHQALMERPNEKAYSKIYDSVFKHVASLIGVPKPKLAELSTDIVQERNSVKDLMKLESDNFLYHFTREVPPSDRDVEKIGYVLEGSATADEVGLGPQGQKWLGLLRDHRVQMDKLQEEAYGHAFPTLDAQTYLTHIYDFGGDSDKLERASQTLIHDRFHKKRSIDSYKDAKEKFGLTPKYRDVADIIRVRDDNAATAAANSRMADTLTGMGVILPQNTYRKLGLSGWNKAADAHALDKAAYGGSMPGGSPILSYRPVMVHPEFEDAINAIFQKDNPGKFFSGVETLRSLQKKMRLSFSFFHPGALTEQAHAIDITRAPVKGGDRLTDIGSRAKRLGQDIYFLNPEAWKGIRTGIWELSNRPEAGKVAHFLGRTVGKEFAPPVLRLAKEASAPWIESGLPLRSAESESLVAGRLRDLASRVKGSGSISKAGGKVAAGAADTMFVWDKSLWEFYHQGLMLNNAESIFADEMSKALKSGKTLSPAEQFELRKSISSHVGNGFGAINYQNLLQSPRAIRAMNFFVMAPAWSLSNIRILSGAFENEIGYRLASQWVKGAAVSWFLTSQLMNYTSTSYYNMPDKKGKKGGHFTWDNPGVPLHVAGKWMPSLTDNSFNIGIGYNPNGTERYLKMGRAFREPFLWALDPLETAGGKVGLIPRWAFVALSGSSPGTGYQDIDLSSPESTRSRVLEQEVGLAAQQFTPFMLTNTQRKALHYIDPQAFRDVTTPSQMAGIPASSGITLSRAAKGVIDALHDGEDDAVVEIMNYASMNNIDPRAVMNLVRRLEGTERRAGQPSTRPTYDVFGKQVGEQSPQAGSGRDFGTVFGGGR